MWTLFRILQQSTDGVDSVGWAVFGYEAGLAPLCEEAFAGAGCESAADSMLFSDGAHEFFGEAVCAD